MQGKGALILVAVCAAQFALAAPMRDEGRVDEVGFLGSELGIPDCPGWELDVFKATCNETLPIADGGVCTTVCPQGYRASSATLTCHNGRFTPDGFACIANGCDVPSPAHADEKKSCQEHYHPQKVPSGSSCTTSCIDGYRPWPPSLTCNEGVYSYDGKEYETFGCKAEADACAVPVGAELGEGIIGEGKEGRNPCVPGAKMAMDEECSVGCDVGYSEVNSDSNHFKCTWTELLKPSLTCVGNPCTVPDLKPHTEGTGETPCVTGKDIGHTSTCSVKCSFGYTARAGSTTSYSCHAGRLTAASLSCDPVDCGPVPNSPHTIVSNCSDDDSDGHKSCTVSCTAGYDGGSSTMTCGVEWTGSPPTCTIRKCGDLPTIANATFEEGCGNEYGSACTARCNNGYEGSASTLSCSAGATWEGTQPTCNLIVCGVNEHVENYVCQSCPPGSYRPSGDIGPDHSTSCIECPIGTYRSSSHDSCVPCPSNSNTTAQGASAVTQCSCNAGFSGSISSEDSKCNACSFDSYKSESGDTKCQSCPEHSTTAGGTARTSIEDCQCSSGYTGGASEGCVACGENTYKTNHGTASCEQCPSHSSTAQKTAVASRSGCMCDPGFQPEETSCVSCPIDTFKSTHANEACSACPLHSNTNGSIGQTSIFDCKCAEGYSVTDNTGSSFSCSPNPCDLTTAHAMRGANFGACSGVATSGKCTASCKAGYTLTGSADFECRSTAQLVNLGAAPLTCTPVMCNSFDARTGTDFSKCNMKATDDHCTVQCLPGYTGEAENFTCTSNGQFVGTMPACKANECPDSFPTDENWDHRDCDGAKTDQDCTVRCAEGYYVPASKGDSESKFKCTPDGFSGSLPPCEVANCAPPAAIDGVDFSVLTDPMLNIGQKATVLCASGYEHTESTATHSILSAVDKSAVYLGSAAGDLFTSTTSTPGAFLIRPALSGTRGAVSFGTEDGRYIVVNQGYAFLQEVKTTFHRELGSFYLHKSLDPKSPGYSFQVVGDQSQYLLMAGQRLTSSYLQNTPEFLTAASFTLFPEMTSVPATITPEYTCLRGGHFTGSLPPACTKKACAAPAPRLGIDFGACTNVGSFDSCEATCAAGFTGAPATLSCEATGELSGDLPSCSGVACNIPSWSDMYDGSDCSSGKRTGDRCFVGCKPGYSSTAVLKANTRTNEDLSDKMFAAFTGNDWGCRDCGLGSYANYPCASDPVTSCRNWCADTPGCKYFQVHTQGDRTGRCCRVKKLPTFKEEYGFDANIMFYSMDSDFLVVDASGLNIRSQEDLNGVCSAYEGMSFVTVSSVDKLEKIYSSLATYDFVDLSLDSGVPLAVKNGNRFLANNKMDVGAILNAATGLETSSFFEKTQWNHGTTGALVGFGFGKSMLGTFNFNQIQAVMCERSFVCSADSNMHGQLPQCTKNRCSIPSHSGVDPSDCYNKRYGETCTARCKANREKLVLSYDMMSSLTAPALKHSLATSWPSTGLTIGLVAKVTTTVQEWVGGSLLVAGGDVDDCCQGSLHIFTQSNAAVGCPKGSNKFAFGFGTTCNSTDVPVYTACKFAVGLEHRVTARFSNGIATLTVNDLVEKEEQRSFVVHPSAQSSYQMTYLSGCHDDETSPISAVVKYVKVWEFVDRTTLTCGEDGVFVGDIPCSSETCPVPPTPLAVDFSDCDGKRPGEVCVVGCHDGSPSTDIAFQSDIAVDTPSKVMSYVKELPHGSPKIYSFLGQVNSLEPEGPKSFLLVGGGVNENCCAGSLYVFAQSNNLVGCPEDSSKYAIGFGVQCDPAGNDPPLFTPCMYSKHTTYSIKVSYGAGVAKIFVNDQEVVSAQKAFVVHSSDEKGYAVTVMNGCHQTDHEQLDGSVSDITVYSSTAQYPLTCKADGTFSGTIPTCMDRVCAPKKQPMTFPPVDYSDCYNRRSGEGCRAQCNLGFSEDGTGSNDVRMDAVLWLEAADLKESHPGSHTWSDHRGVGYGDAVQVSPVNVHLDSINDGVKFSGEGHVTINGVDIRPQTNPSVSLEMWVKLDNVASGSGCVVGSDGGSYERTLCLYETQGAPSVDPETLSHLGATETGVWNHFVAVWSPVVAGSSVSSITLYKNGNQEILSKGFDESDGGLDHIVLGMLPSKDPGSGIHGWVSTFRVYYRKLSAEEVHFLFLEGRSQSAQQQLPMSKDIRQSALLWLQAGDIRQDVGSWQDHRGPSYSRYNINLAGASGVSVDQQSASLKFDCGSLTIEGLNPSPAFHRAITFEAWVKILSVPTGSVGWLMGHEDGTYDRGIMLHTSTKGTWLSAGSSTFQSGGGPGAPEIGEWMHVVGVYTQNGQAVLYKNGFKYVVSSAVVTSDGRSNLVLGSPPASSDCIDTLVSSVRVYGRALDAFEVDKLYLMGDPAIPVPDATALANSATAVFEGRDLAADGLWKDHREHGPCTMGGQIKDHSSKAAVFTPQSKSVVSCPTTWATRPDGSLEAWVKINSYLSTQQRLIGDGIRDVFVGAPNFGNSDNFMHLSMSTPGTSRVSLLGRIETDSWIHLVAVWKSSGFAHLYVDGIPYRMSDGPAAEYDGRDVEMTVGANSDGMSGFDGLVSTVRIHSQALSHADVRALYKLGHYASGTVQTVRDTVPDIVTEDGNDLSVSCMAGRVVHIQSAFYGDMGGACRSSVALNKLMTACEGKSVCSVPVNSALLGCASTVNRLELNYECQSLDASHKKNPLDIRQGAVIWLDAADSSTSNGKTLWADHRGGAYSRRFDIVPDASVLYDSSVGGFKIQKSDCKGIDITGFDLTGLTAHNSITIEVWAMLQNGWSTDWTLYTTNKCAGLANSVSFDSSGTTSETAQWTHFTATWSGLDASFYRNGVKTSSSTSNRGTTPGLTIAGFDGWVSVVRVYSRAITPLEVSALYLNGRSSSTWMAHALSSSSSLKCGSDGQFSGQAPTCVANTCSPPSVHTGVDLSACAGKRTGDTCSVGCAEGYEGHMYTFSGPDSKACVTYTTYDRLPGKTTLKECKDACKKGVRGCAEGCSTYGDTGKVSQCDTIGYDAAEQKCVIYSGCQAGSKSHKSMDFYGVTIATHAKYTCGVFGQFSGTPPKCQPKETTYGGLSQTCDGQSKTFTCGDGKLIKIRSATYGRSSPLVCPGPFADEECSVDGAMEKVQDACDGRESCTVFSGSTTFGTNAACEGLRKYLEVDYTCHDPSDFHSHHKLTCDNEHFRITCSADRVISLRDVSYGRTEYDPCPIGVRMTDTPCSAEDAVAFVKEQCSGKSECSFDVSSSKFGQDPCSGISKYLSVKYDCIVPPPSEIVCQNDLLSLECPASRELHIKSAVFGRQANDKTCLDESQSATECSTPDALNVLRAACEGRRACSLNATAPRFGNSCGSNNYLKVNHECRIATTIPNTVSSRVSVCDQTNTEFSCGTDYVLSIESATFGPESCSTNTFGAVRAACDGKTSCSLSAKTPDFGASDCAEAANPRCLTVDYQCIHKSRPTVVACQGDIVNVTCPDGKDLAIVQASYGRMEYDLCPHPKRTSTSCLAANSADLVRSMCTSAPCEIWADDSVFGNPCADTYKYLAVSWTCGGEAAEYASLPV